MENQLLIAAVCLSVISVIINIVIYRHVKNSSAAGAEYKQAAAMERLKESISSMLYAAGEGDRHNTELLVSMLGERLNAIEARVMEMSRLSEARLDNLRETVDRNIKFLQQSSADDLKEMRFIVDEKLSRTLDTRLNKSFELINSRLEAVYKGLGEMQGLAKGVGDLKKVLSNVKTRGTFGEVQLEMLLEQILNPQQYLKNAVVDAMRPERVDFAIKMPGKGGDFIFLPIDAKFPLEQYTKLCEAAENMDTVLQDKFQKALQTRVLEEGRKISEKYIVPPYTTDFAIMYLPIEGLYAEVLRNGDIAEILQRKYKIIVCGPTTLGALLNSLQMGFKTLAIEKRSSEIWELLSAFKTEFGKFTEIISRTQKKLTEATNSMDDAARKTRTIERKLKNVSVLGGGAEGFLDKGGDSGDLEDGDEDITGTSGFGDRAV